MSQRKKIKKMKRAQLSLAGITRWESEFSIFWFGREEEKRDEGQSETDGRSRERKRSMWEKKKKEKERR